MKKELILILAILSFSCITNAQEFDSKIDALIEKAVRLNRFNGSVLVSKNGKIIYEKAFGYQNAEKKILNTSNTVYQIGSTTKEFTAAVILKLVSTDVGTSTGIPPESLIISKYETQNGAGRITSSPSLSITCAMLYKDCLAPVETTI